MGCLQGSHETKYTNMEGERKHEKIELKKKMELIDKTKREKKYGREEKE